MSDQALHEGGEGRLREIASAFAYPPTPDIAGAVRARIVREQGGTGGRRPLATAGRRLGWAAAAVVLALMAASLAVPEVRAGVVELVERVFQIGSITIRVVPSTPTPTGTVTPGPTATAAPAAWNPRLAGETTLEDARSRLNFTVKLPTYPQDVGPPDRVFAQTLGGPAVVLAWLDRARPDRPRMVLYELSSDAFVEKTLHETTLLQETTVNGRRAFWVRGPHVVQVRTSSGVQLEPLRLVEGNILNWEEGGISYRLESELSLEEAKRVAESLR